MNRAIEDVWDWAGKFSENVHNIDKIRKLSADAFKPLSCGDCYWWMKSRDCPREKNVNGQTRGPSSGGFPCPKMQQTKQSIEHRSSLRAEITRLSIGGDQ